MLPFLLLLAAIVSAPPSPPAVTTPNATAGERVQIVNQGGRWTGLATLDELGDDREPMFLISGELVNSGTTPIAAVKLVYELLVDGMDGDVVVASEYGYNFRAEALRAPAVEAGEISAASVEVSPLRPGERDMFRMAFLRGDVPRFDRWRVRIVDVSAVARGGVARENRKQEPGNRK